MTDQELQDFIIWHKGRFKRTEVPESVLLTCMCGAFHSYPRAMKHVLKRMSDLGLIKRKGEQITIL